MKRYYFEALSDSLSAQVDLIQSEKGSLRSDYEKIIALERANNTDLKEKFRNQKSISSSHEEENKHLKKKVRARTWQRNGLGVIALALVVLSVSR